MKILRVLYYILLITLPIQLGRHFWPSFSYVSGIRVDYLSPTFYFTDVILLALLLVWLWGKRHFITRHTVRQLARSASKILKKFQDDNKRIVLIIVFCCFGLLISLNIILSQTPLLSLYGFIRLGFLLLFILYIRSTKPSFFKSYIFLSIGAYYTCLIALLQTTMQKSVGGVFYFFGERTFSITTPAIARAILGNELFLRPYSIFPHPNALAGYLVIMILFTLGIYGIIQKRKANKYDIFLIFISLLLYSFVLIATLSRSAWFGLLFGILLFFVLIIKYIYRNSVGIFIKKWGSIIAVLFSIFIFSVSILVTRISSLPIDPSNPIVSRNVLNALAFQLIQKHPIVGVGMNHFITSSTKLAVVQSYTNLQPVHNIYLLTLSELGIPLTITFLVLTIIILKELFNTLITNIQSSSSAAFGEPGIHKMDSIRIDSHLHHVRRSFRENDEMCITLICSITAIGIISLFDHYWYTIHQTQLLFTLIIGLSLATIKKSS